MAKFKLRRPKITLVELMIILAIICILLAILIPFFGGPGSREGRCRELCEGLRHRMVKVTPDACICEDPKTKDRKAYPMGGLRH